MMSREPVPAFVKAMGHRIVGYVLNISETEARRVLTLDYRLSNQQRVTFASYLELCRHLRDDALSQGDTERSFFQRLPRARQSETHIFNVWHYQHNGKFIVPYSEDVLAYRVCLLAAELYPLFLVKTATKRHMFYRMSGHLSATIAQTPEYKQLCHAFLGDASFERLFEEISNDPFETLGRYSDSRGHKSVISLASLPAALLLNSYDLMRARGPISQRIFVSTVKEMLDTARGLADGEVAQIPLFVGFRNASLGNLDELATKWGVWRRYSPAIAEYVLQTPKAMARRKSSGFILESGMSYAINVGELVDDDEWPDEVLVAEEERLSTEYNISMCLALCYLNNKSSFTAPEWVWTIDPFSLEGGHRLVDTVAETDHPVVIEKSHLDDIEQWSLLLEDTDSTGIRLAFSRLVSAAQFPSATDGLLDAMIAFRNIFAAGSHPERIRDAVTKLLAGETTGVLELVDRIEQAWEAVFTGDVWYDKEEIAELTQSCISLCLVCLHHLYLKHRELVSDPIRLEKLVTLDGNS
ncbi:hypothetical protein NF212_23755 [Parasalinivibrio latis]|uniref:hypothetical protein n=1 Tax=Parasalinivibrio latis TaxID=2952610 RepID=UPI0030DFDEB8